MGKKCIKSIFKLMFLKLQMTNYTLKALPEKLFLAALRVPYITTKQKLSNAYFTPRVQQKNLTLKPNIRHQIHHS